jgi:hypothetical protein
MLLLLAGLFAAPLAISFLMYYGHSSLQPTGRVNHGDLLIPAVPLPAAGDPALLRHKWTLVFIGDGACDERCRKALYDMRQVRLALDRDMLRVQRVFVATGGGWDPVYLRREHPDLILVRADAAAGPLIAAIRTAVPGDRGRIFLVDPLSNLVMSYAPDAPAKGMLDDMKRLLKLSQIG